MGTPDYMTHYAEVWKKIVENPDGTEAMYFAESAWDGETYPTPEDIAESDGYYGDDDAAPEGAERVVVLGPVN